MSSDSNAATPQLLPDGDSGSKVEIIAEVLDRVCANISDSVICFDIHGAIVARNAHAARTLQIEQKQFIALKTTTDLIQFLAARGDYGSDTSEVEHEVKRSEQRLQMPIERKCFFTAQLKTLGHLFRFELAPLVQDLRMMTIRVEAGEVHQPGANTQIQPKVVRKPRRSKLVQAGTDKLAHRAPAQPAVVPDDLAAIATDLGLGEEATRLFEENTFEQHLLHAIEHASVLDSSFALMALHFPELDGLIKKHGEETKLHVHRTMFEKLKLVTRDIDILISVDNRRFLLVLEAEDAAILKKISRRIMQCCSDPIAIQSTPGSRTQNFIVSMGAVMFPNSLMDLPEKERYKYARKRAEMAAVRAQREGREELVIFDVDDVGNATSTKTAATG